MKEEPLRIFDVDVRSRAMEAIRFFCPRCGGDRTAARVEERRWLTALRLPVLPLRRLGHGIRCETCHRSYGLDAADAPTTAEMASALSDATYAITVMAVRTTIEDHPDRVPAVRARASAELAALVAGYDDARLDQEALRIDPAAAGLYVHRLGTWLDVPGKEHILAELVGLAISGAGDGVPSIGPATSSLVADVALGLGITNAHRAGIVDAICRSHGAGAERGSEDPTPER